MLIISDGDFLKVYKLHCKWEDHALAARFLPIRAFFFLFGRFFSWKKISLLEATLASRFESSFNNFFFVCFARKAGEERNNWYKNLMRMSKKKQSFGVWIFMLIPTVLCISFCTWLSHFFGFLKPLQRIVAGRL